jgi:apolipoprotein N-acyltransferase
MRPISARLWLLALLSGILQILPFPIAGPLPVWRSIFSWFALLPLLVAITPATEAGQTLPIRQAALLGYLSGVVWYLGNCYWIYQTMNLYGGIAKPASLGILLLFSLYLGLYHALFAGILSMSCRAGFGRRAALLLSPLAWVAVEFARGRITGFPWDLLALTQIDNPVLTRLAPYTGAWGISFIVAAVNAAWLIPLSLRERRYTRNILTVTGVAFVIAYVAAARYLMPPRREAAPAAAVLVQENLSVGAEASGPVMDKQEMLRTFSEMSLFPPPQARCDGIPEAPQTRCQGFAAATAASNAPITTTTFLAPADVIVWPESPAPFEDSDPDFRQALSHLARTAHSAVIADNVAIVRNRTVKRGYNQFNSADFIRPDGSFAGRYDKMHLVPFGEYTPYKNLFFFAGSLLQDVGLFDPGTNRVVFQTGGHTFGTFICYESIFGDEVRQFVRNGAQVLVNISDDGWYGDTSAPWEHLNMVRMRAIETHRWVLRATNSGVTAAIDPYGRVTNAAPRHLRTSLRVHFEYEPDLTFYVRHGDWFAWLCSIVTAAMLVISLARAHYQRTD